MEGHLGVNRKFPPIIQANSRLLLLFPPTYINLQNNPNRTSCVKDSDIVPAIYQRQGSRICPPEDSRALMSLGYRTQSPLKSFPLFTASR